MEARCSQDTLFETALDRLPDALKSGLRSAGLDDRGLLDIYSGDEYAALIAYRESLGLIRQWLYGRGYWFGCFYGRGGFDGVWWRPVLFAISINRLLPPFFLSFSLLPLPSRLSLSSCFVPLSPCRFALEKGFEQHNPAVIP